MAPFKKAFAQPEQLLQPGNTVIVNGRDETWTLHRIADEDGPIAYLRREEADRNGSRQILLKSRLENVHKYVEPAPQPNKKKAA